MSQLPYRVVTYMNEWCRMDMVESRHVHDWVMSHMHESCYKSTYMSEACRLFKWVVLHIWMSHVTLWMSHVTCMNASCCTYPIYTLQMVWRMEVNETDGAKSHISISHVTCVNEPCHVYQWVMSHIWMSHVTQTERSHVSHRCCCGVEKESYNMYEWAMSHI